MAKKKHKMLFVRHGESEANVKGVFAGQRENSPLTQKGIEQAKLAAQNLVQKGIKPSRLYVSPLKRAVQTAEIIVKHAGLTETQIIIDSRVIEYDMGSLTGTPIHKVTSHELVSAEGAENATVFMERVHNLISEVCLYEEDILIVSHAGVGRIIEARKRKMKAEDFYSLDAFPNAEVIEI